jgi:hypothetical protein
MMDTLSYLHLSCPSVRCPLLLAVITLQVSHGKFDDKSLLKYGILDFFLHCNPQFDPPGMHLCVHKSSIYHLDSFKSLDIFQA